MPEATGNPLAKALLIIAICVRSFTYRTAACGPSAINASIEPTRPPHTAILHAALSTHGPAETTSQVETLAPSGQAA